MGKAVTRMSICWICLNTSAFSKTGVDSREPVSIEVLIGFCLMLYIIGFRKFPTSLTKARRPKY